MIKAKALKIAHYDFIDSKNIHISTSKLIVSLGEFGTYTLCSSLANDYEIGSILKVECDYQKNKLVITNIIEII